VLSKGECITSAAIAPQSGPCGSGGEPFKTAKSRVVNEFEKSYIKGLLATHSGNISKSAHAAQKNRRAFFQLIRKHRIDVENFK
jgi:DNA-binding NtrC family response regulator